MFAEWNFHIKFFSRSSLIKLLKDRSAEASSKQETLSTVVFKERKETIHQYHGNLCWRQNTSHVDKKDG